MLQNAYYCEIGTAELYLVHEYDMDYLSYLALQVCCCYDILHNKVAERDVRFVGIKVLLFVYSQL